METDSKNLTAVSQVLEKAIKESTIKFCYSKLPLITRVQLLASIGTSALFALLLLIVIAYDVKWYLQLITILAFINFGSAPFIRRYELQRAQRNPLYYLVCIRESCRPKNFLTKPLFGGLY